MKLYKNLMMGMLLTLCTFLYSTPLFAGDVQKLITETQYVDQTNNHFNLVWWMPNEFWSFQDMKDKDVASLLDAIGDYCVICVVDAELTSLGSVVPLPRAEVLPKLSLHFADGVTLLPLSDAEISSDALNFFAMMKPIMANMLGQFGQGMEFVCFKGNDVYGKRRPDPLHEGSFTLKLGSREHTFRLPLGSLLPIKIDPVSREEFPGNYKFNPYSGKKLIIK